MLPREYRLKKKKDFDKVFKKGKTIAGKLIFLKYLKNNLKNSRFGFIVSTKISKKAVLRNRIKRQLKAVIKKNLSNLKSGLDIVIIVKPEIVNKKYQDIKDELEDLFKSI